jgi:5-methylcytosine-specific restriction endonuclease McrA
MRRYRQRLTAEQRARNWLIQRRRRADHQARLRAEKMGAVAVHVELESIIRRDGNLCYLCGRETSVHDVSFEHVVPLVAGGSHTPENIRVAHQRCNSKKGARLLSQVDWQRW